ncbi:hypothetical protein ACFYY8_08995 [Streptosporangium sp. NPDC001559]|uniref:hypothetical protein n=1 Tax=Streptosporangium sp. NPDC001559 TaxID=3366187 RepID=UPI0036EE9153
MSAVGAGAFVLGGGPGIHAAGAGDAVPPDVGRADGTAGFRVWLSGPGSEARLTVVATPGTEIRFVGCPASGLTPGPGSGPEPGAAVESLEGSGPSGASEGWRECLLGEVGARTSVDVLVGAPTAGDWPVGLAALLRMRTPEGEWVTRTATGLRGARPAGGLGEADPLTRQRSEGIGIEPIAWERPEGSGSSAPGTSGTPEVRGVPGSPGEAGAGGRESAWAPSIRGPGTIPPAQGAPPVREQGETLPAQGTGVPHPVLGAEVVPPVRKPGAARPVQGSGAVPPALGVEVVPPVQGSGSVRPVPEAEVVPPEGGSGEVDQGVDPGRDRGEVAEAGVQPGPGPYETVKPPRSHGAAKAPKGPGAGRRAEVPRPPVPAGVPGTGQTANMPGAGAAVSVPGAGQVPPLWNDPDLRMPLAAPTAVGAGPPVSPAIATDVPPPGAPLPQDVDGPGQEIEPVALWTPSLTGANGFPVVGGSVGGLLGLLWLQARIQRRRGTR